MRILIIGAGPTGLGAAWRLTELGHDDFLLCDAREYAGGLASSFVDEKGFTWDIGGHVQFSHYAYFDALMESLLPKEWLMHERESWVWMRGGFVPYPFQNNIRHLPKAEMQACLAGLIETQNIPPSPPKNFREWILASFGKGIADVFMVPYNFKVWAYPPEKMSFTWIGERVATVDIQRVKENIEKGRDDVSWGPNNTFRFPLRGGTGEIWRRLFSRIDKAKVRLGVQVVGVDTIARTVRFADGATERYDALISTMPLDTLLHMADVPDKSPAKKLMHSSTHIVGIGMRGAPPAHLKTKCWMYFPEDNCPFYRVTVFSNYSPNNVPDASKFWSLMCEVSESPDKPVNHASVVEDVIEGALATKLIASRDDIVDVWHHFEPYGYPTPSLHRDEALVILKALDEIGVYSRGRFGAWKYEVSNQDHSLMQGIEVVNRILKGEPEQTVWHPSIVNAPRRN